MKIEQYFKQLESQVKEVYVVAEEARKKGLDPVSKVEIPLARSMAEKVVGLISAVYPQLEGVGVDKRIHELEKEYGKLDVAVAFKIAEEIAKQKFCKFSTLLEAIDAGIRVGFAYQTIGVVSPPIEGFTELKIEKTRDGKEYFKAYFSGPIRAAGTTASCMVLMLIDYLRELFGYAKYDPTEDEIKRYVTENTDYHDRITNLQYFPTEEEILFLARHIPIQIAGEKTERLEVSNYKNLERVETNYIRGGMCLIFSEGLAQKAAKGFRLLNSVKARGFKSTGFDFLKEYIELHEKRDKGKTDDSPTYIKDLVAGRPVFGHPSESGAFRFRYGRSRVSGFSAASVHPATMEITDGFIATGTQLKIEKPTKGMVVTVCDRIDGPIVKLYNGSVKKVKTQEEAKKLYPDTEEIIYLGDLLFPFSDVLNRNSLLLKPGYVEEWWDLELKEKGCKEKIDPFDVSFEKAVEISGKFKIPLHPSFIFYWNEISQEQFQGLIEWIKYGFVDGKLILPYNKIEQDTFEIGKRALELLGVEHEVTIENVVLDKVESMALFANLGMDFSLFDGNKKVLKEVISEKKFSGECVFDIVNNSSEFTIKDKSGEFIGSRMGRPEKAKLRKLVGSPNVLFPIGKEGGRLRSVQTACEVGNVKSVFPLLFCENCKKETVYRICEDCNTEARQMFYCPRCKEKSFEKCKEHEVNNKYSYQNLDVNRYFNWGVNKLGLLKDDVPLLIKGIRGTSSGEHHIENLAKGILRARHDLQVNKDGTIRFDATELPVVSFKPAEVDVGLEKLRELGYDKDIYGRDLVDTSQIIELMPHDVFLPCSPDSPDEKADDVFMRITDFVDEELEKFYGMNSFYNLKRREDLVGQIGVCMAPHNCAGVVCRFIGFSKTLGIMASPYMHAAIRRDCDGDEAAIMLLGDVLLNFSRKFLPSHRGGTQDAPLVLNVKIDAGEVDDQILDFEYSYGYPLDLYRFAEQKRHSGEINKDKIRIKTARQVLEKEENPFVDIGFTHDTTDFNAGVLCSSYKSLATMQDKLHHQMELVEKLRAVDTSDTARLVIERHFIRDMRGNLRNFSTQSFRCVECNEIVRRPSLKGVCPKCRGKLIFTVHEGGIKKYLEPALDLAQKYDLSQYMKQNLELVKRYLESIFGRELEKQEALEKWF